MPVTVAGQTGAASAAMYSYTGADLSAIHRVGNVAFSAGAADVTLPGYSMSMLVLQVQ